MIEQTPLINAGEAGSFTPVGAHVLANGGVFYRAWAPDRRGVRVEIQRDNEARFVELDPDGDGHFSGVDLRGAVGDFYSFELDGLLFPDPVSRAQPHGVEGASQVVDPEAYTWLATDWKRPSFKGRVIYELHVGTFTLEGTFTAAISRLDALVDLGINTVELMPLAAFAGERNWGYDGVMLFAPARCYGRPDDLRAFIDAAHARGIAVMLDVVYNHLGPSGNVLPDFTSRYFHESEKNVWGHALNYEEIPVRRFFIQNVCTWLDEYRFDGLRLDAVHAIKDKSPRPIVADLAAAAHARGAWVIAEDERNEARLITAASEGGWGVDAAWSDDFHHSVRVALTGQHDAHFDSFTGKIGEWKRTIAQGWLYQGQFFPHWKKPRGSSAEHLPTERFVYCISNHDQVGNRPLGDRLHHTIEAPAYRAASILLCLSPYTPMLFMGQEWAASSPFLFFTELPGKTGAKMRESRLAEFKHYGAHYKRETLEKMPDPQAEDTFTSSKLDWTERSQGEHEETLALYRSCLRLRAKEPIFQNPARDRWTVNQISEHVLALRWAAPAGDWLLLAGVTEGAQIITFDDPVIHHAEGRSWELVIDSNQAASSPSWHVAKAGYALSLPGAVLLRESAKQ